MENNMNFRSVNCCSCPFYMLFLTIFIVFLSLSQLFESSVIEEVGRFGLIPSTLVNPKKFVRIDGGELGVFIGTEEEGESSESYYSFLGIPYGKARRWENPGPVEIRTRTVDATRYRAICPHWSHKENKGVGHIDCLFLNVFTPHLPMKSMGKYLNLSEIARKRFLKPVIVFFDGRYSAEASEENYRPEGLMGNYGNDSSALFINVNYRTGVYGFLSNNNRSLPGNYGLLDQLSALRWIKKNIGRFGGNPSRVTIMGDVKFILVSPLGKGLFQRAIILSEDYQVKVMSSFYFKIKNQSSSAELIGKELGCSLESDSALLDCLQVTPMEKILKAENSILKKKSNESIIGPTVDEGLRQFPVLPLHPINLLENGEFSRVPVMLGIYENGENSLTRRFFREVIRSENDISLNFLFNNTEAKLYVYDQFFDFLKEVFKTSLLDLRKKDFDNIWEYYFEDAFDGLNENFNNKNESTLFNRMSKLFDDFQVHFPNWRLIMNLAKHLKYKPIYIYLLNHKDEEYYDDLIRKQNSLREIEILKLKKRKKDGKNNLSLEKLWKIYIAFSEFGIPKSAISSFGNWTVWKRVDFNENYYPFYDLNNNQANTLVNFRKNEASFWDTIYDSILNDGIFFSGSLKLNILCLCFNVYIYV